MRRLVWIVEVGLYLHFLAAKWLYFHKQIDKWYIIYLQVQYGTISFDGQPFLASLAQPFSLVTLQS